MPFTTLERFKASKSALNTLGYEVIIMEGLRYTVRTKVTGRIVQENLTRVNVVCFLRDILSIPKPEGSDGEDKEQTLPPFRVIAHKDDPRSKPLSTALDTLEQLEQTTRLWIAGRESDRKNYLDSREYEEHDKALLEDVNAMIKTLEAVETWLKPEKP